jgi:hypothetical protein
MPSGKQMSVQHEIKRCSPHRAFGAGLRGINKVLRQDVRLVGIQEFLDLDIGYRSTYYMARFPFFHSYIGIQPARTGSKLVHADHAAGIHHVALWARNRKEVDDFYSLFLLKNNITARCHCGDVEITADALPEILGDCNCSICRRYKALWGYYAPGSVSIKTRGDATAAYIWGDREVAFQY